VNLSKRKRNLRKRTPGTKRRPSWHREGTVRTEELHPEQAKDLSSKKTVMYSQEDSKTRRREKGKVRGQKRVEMENAGNSSLPATGGRGKKKRKKTIKGGI